MWSCESCVVIFFRSCDVIRIFSCLLFSWCRIFISLDSSLRNHLFLERLSPAEVRIHLIELTVCCVLTQCCTYYTTRGVYFDWLISFLLAGRTHYLINPRRRFGKSRQFHGVCPRRWIRQWWRRFGSSGCNTYLGKLGKCKFPQCQIYCMPQRVWTC